MLDKSTVHGTSPLMDVYRRAPVEIIVLTFSLRGLLGSHRRALRDRSDV